MEFRPCIDIHNGKVKQIVGSSLRDEGNAASENYVSGEGARHFAELYRMRGLKGGHVIILNSRNSEYYKASAGEAFEALRAYPGGLQAGGGIDDTNCGDFLDAGASHVIVTSFVFRDGLINEDNLERMAGAAGREHLCLDLSCRKRDGGSDYFVVTDRWQKYTDVRVDEGLLQHLAGKCSEFLVHAVDAEGKQQGIADDLIPVLLRSPIPVTYAGGIGKYSDIEHLRDIGCGRINVTAGSAMKIFGGTLDLDAVLRIL